MASFENEWALKNRNNLETDYKMRRIYLSFFAFFLALGMEAQTMVKVQVTNPSKVERNDEPVVLDLSKYGEVSKAVVTVDGK